MAHFRYKKEEWTVKILEMINSNPKGLTIEELSKLLMCNRVTAGKYLMVLEATKKVSLKMIGNSRYYYPVVE